MDDAKQLIQETIANKSMESEQPTDNNQTESPSLGGGSICDFEERDRVKILSPSQYANRHGYIVESHKIQNSDKFMEVELDYELNDAKGYEKLEGRQPRERIIIKDPSKQLQKYEFMKSNYLHFSTDLRAESFLGVSG